MYGHTYSKGMDQPDKVANPAVVSWTGKLDISMSAFAPENLDNTVQRMLYQES